MGRREMTAMRWATGKERGMKQNKSISVVWSSTHRQVAQESGNHLDRGLDDEGWPMLGDALREAKLTQRGGEVL